jgi:hypothetical protein
MSKETFQFRYFWEKVENNEMKANDVASSIFALSSLLSNVNNTLWNNFSVELKIKAIKSWSFEIEFIVESIWVWLLALSQTWMTIKDLLDLIWIIGWWWLISLLKTLKREPIIDTKTSWDNTTITYWNNNTITITNNVYKIFSDWNSRKELDTLIQPISEWDIEWLEVIHWKEKNTIINKENAEYLKYDWESNSEKIIEEEENILKIEIMNFNDWKKWNFSSAWNTFWARIEDNNFDIWWKQFAKWDKLKVNLKIIKVWNEVKERIITKVLEHIKMPEQISID